MPPLRSEGKTKVNDGVDNPSRNYQTAPTKNIGERSALSRRDADDKIKTRYDKEYLDRR